jgi:hypothetical protein
MLFEHNLKSEECLSPAQKGSLLLHEERAREHSCLNAKAKQ